MSKVRGNNEGDWRVTWAGPATSVITGTHLAIRAVREGETGIADLICRYGSYGNLAPRGYMPPCS